MRILVTGGAGFIGSHVVEHLLGRGHEVVALDDFNNYYNPAFKHRNLAQARQHVKFSLVEADVSNLERVRDVFQNGRLDMVIHLAARAGVRASVKDPFLYQRVNVEGTLNILECARGAGVKKVTFGSTSSVYGLNARVPFSEEDALLNTASPYSATKLAGEALCRAYSHLHGMDIAVLRFFSVYGPRGRPDMAIYLFSESILQDRTVGVYGDGSSSRDYTYIDDIVQGVVATTEREFGFEIFNLGESETTVLLDMIRLLEKALGRKARVQHLPEQPGDVPRTCARIEKARGRLGYRPGIKIQEGIPRFVEWLKKELPA